MVTLATIIVDVTEVGVIGWVPWLLVRLRVMPLLKLVPVIAILRVVACTMPGGEIEVMVALLAELPPPPLPLQDASVTMAAKMKTGLSSVQISCFMMF
jgi:hypothetical protein